MNEYTLLRIGLWGGVDMIWYIMLGTLAAFGLFCVLWVLLGCLLPGSQRCTVVLLCEPKEELALLRRLLWIRELGLFRCGILLSGQGLSPGQRLQIRQKYRSIEFCDPEFPGE